MWITSFEKQKENANQPATPPKPNAKPVDTRPAYIVKGLYLENPPLDAGVVDQFVDELNKSKYFEVDKSPGKYTRVPPTGADWAYDFSFPLIIKDGKEPAKDEKGGAKKK